MREILYVSIATILACGCGDKQSAGGDKATGPSGPSGPASPAVEVDKAQAGATTGVGQETGTKGTEARGEPTCDCSMLTDHSLADLEGGKFQALCDGLKLVEGSSCDQFDWMRNCIYAAHGNKFKRERWQKRFAGYPWYKPRDDFKESELSQLELTNIRTLKERASACRAKESPSVTAADIKLITTWFANRDKQTPPPVWHEEEDQPSNDPKKSIESRLGYWKLTDKIHYSYRARPDSDALYESLAGKNYRTVSVADCYQCAADEPDCESGCDIFEVVIGDNNKIMALYLTVAAACPFVYSGAEGEPLIRRGEILRHLDRPGLQATQRLPLSKTCSGAIAVRLAEEKPEVTFLDEVYLDVDGVRIDPRSCAHSAHCREDGRYTKLAPDEHLELTFDVDAPGCRRIDLVANGFYMPL